MASQRGSDVVLYMGDGAEPEVFNMIGGLMGLDLAFSSNLVDSTTVTSTKWRGILDGEGQRSVSVNASGRYTGATTEDRLRSAAFMNALKNFEIRFGGGDVLSGSFKVADYKRSGSIKKAETYSVYLQSNGEITYSEG